tara:strand:- start:357 stop:824 length:468 start_codon:yes stop_codon:yes gene_type:complete
MSKDITFKKAITTLMKQPEKADDRSTYEPHRETANDLVRMYTVKWHRCQIQIERKLTKLNEMAQAKGFESFADMPQVEIDSNHDIEEENQVLENFKLTQSEHQQRIDLVPEVYAELGYENPEKINMNPDMSFMYKVTTPVKSQRPVTTKQPAKLS